MNKRELWPVENPAKVEGDFRDAEEKIRPERLARLRFIQEEFGPPADMLLTGGIGAMFAINELKWSFVYGNFMATIFLCQTFAEHSLAGPFALGGDDEHVERGMKHLIDESLKRKAISSDLAARLNELREMRNPYTHPRILQKKQSLLDRVVKTKKEPWSMAEADAKTAIQIVVDFLREGCPSWVPSAHQNSTKV